MTIETIKSAKIEESNYENVIAICPYCKIENTFNRATDLKTLEPISGREVTCVNTNCLKIFHVYGDLFGDAYEYLIGDCNQFIKQKRYMYCIVNLCQACERFFAKAIENRLLYEPAKKKIIDRDDFNNLSELLYKNWKSYPYEKMRNLFFDIFLNDRHFNSKKEIEGYIKCISKNILSDKDIDKKIQSYNAGETKILFLKLRNLKINDLRNDIVHKTAYRPTFVEVKNNLEEVRDIIFGLKDKFKIQKEMLFFI